MTTSGAAGTDREFLRTDQYRNEQNLEARRAIYDHLVEGGDFFTPALAALGTADSVVDVGCGPGVWNGFITGAHPLTRWIGLDLSVGMATAAAAAGRVPVGVADAVALPLGDDTVAGGIAVHMLYHVPPLEQPVALAELGRVVRPGGPIVVTTNAPDHLGELDELLTLAGRDAGLELPQLGFALSFVLDDAGHALMSDAFGAVETVHARGRLAITDPEVIAGYIGSLASLPELGADAPDENGMTAVVSAARRRATATIDRHGSFDVHSHAGVFIAHA